MFRFWIPFAVITLFSLAAYGEDARDNALPAPGYKTTLERASYAIGMSIGHGIEDDRLELDVDALVQGIRDVLANARPRLTDDQISAALKIFGEQMEAKAKALAKATGEKNLREGKPFLAANKSKRGVKTLLSGLQYTVIKNGNGPKPKLTDTVRAHYHGTLLDGTVFGSTIESKEPAEFAVGGVIRGWSEALQMMQVGSKWRLFVPSELAYGSGGFAPAIGPHAVLIFEVELVGIK